MGRRARPHRHCRARSERTAVIVPQPSCPPAIALVGRPGAGKGTQAQLLARHGHWIALSTGDLLRVEIGRGTAIGLAVSHYVGQGLLVPNPLVMKTLFARLEPLRQRGHAVVLDGFPRTVLQSLALDQLLGARRLDLVVELEIPPDVAFARLGLRARDDDTRAAIARRLEAFELVTEPMLDWYRRSGRVQRVDADRPIEDLQKELGAILDLVLARDENERQPVEQPTGAVSA